MIIVRAQLSRFGALLSRDFNCTLKALLRLCGVGIILHKRQFASESIESQTRGDGFHFHLLRREKADRRPDLRILSGLPAGIGRERIVEPLALAPPFQYSSGALSPSAVAPLIRGSKPESPLLGSFARNSNIDPHTAAAAQR